VSDTLKVPIPRQEVVDTLGWMVRQTGQHVGEPSLWIDVIELGALCRPPNYAEPRRFPQISR